MLCLLLAKRPISRFHRTCQQPWLLTSHTCNSRTQPGAMFPSYHVLISNRRRLAMGLCNSTPTSVQSKNVIYRPDTFCTPRRRMFVRVYRCICQHRRTHTTPRFHWHTCRLDNWWHRMGNWRYRQCCTYRLGMICTWTVRFGLGRYRVGKQGCRHIFCCCGRRSLGCRC